MKSSKGTTKLSTTGSYLAIFGGLSVVGMLEGVRAVLIPNIQMDLGLSYTQIGTLLLFSFMGFVVCALITGFLADWLGDKKIMIIGLAMIVGAGLLFVTIQQYLMLVLLYIALRSGVGSVDIVTSAHGARIFKRRAEIQMNLLHTSFAVGAAASPVIAIWLLGRGFSWQQIYAMISVTAMLYIVAMAFSANTTVKKPSLATIKKNIRFMITNKMVWFFGMMLTLALMLEGVFLEWIKNYLLVTKNASDAQTTSILTTFYVGLIISRAVGGYIGNRFGIKRLFTVHVLMGITTFVLIYFFPLVLVLYVVYGWFVGPLFPFVVILTNKTLPDYKGASIGILIAIGGITTVLFTTLIGVIHDVFSTAVGFGAIPIGMLTLFSVYLVLSATTIIKRALPER